MTQKLVRPILLISTIITLGSACTNTQGNKTDEGGTPPKIKKMSESSSWLVKAKTCGAQTQAIHGIERLKIGNGFLAYIFQNKDTQLETCNQGNVFNRVIQKSEFQDSSYLETSTLAATQSRIVCKEKASGKVLSDSTIETRGPIMNLSLTFNGDRGVAEIIGSPNCSGAVQRIELEPKPD